MSNLTNLGSLEEVILLIVMGMDGEAYGISVAEKYQSHSRKSISIPAIHTVLRRLESKKMIISKVGGATHQRGGRSKRIYQITRLGNKTLSNIKESRKKLWELVPSAQKAK